MDGYLLGLPLISASHEVTSQSYSFTVRFSTWEQGSHSNNVSKFQHFFRTRENPVGGLGPT